MTGPKAPAGWYPGGDGTQRYWDGDKWLDIPAPPTAPQQQFWGASNLTAPAPSLPTGNTPKKKMSPITVIAIVTAGFFVFAVLASIATPEPDKESSVKRSSLADYQTTPAKRTSGSSYTANENYGGSYQNKGGLIGQSVSDGQFMFIVKSWDGHTAEIHVKNTGNRSGTYFGSNQKAVDAENREFDCEDEVSKWGVELQPGDTFEGSFTCKNGDIPAAAIELHDSMFSGGVRVKAN